MIKNKVLKVRKNSLKKMIVEILSFKDKKKFFKKDDSRNSEF